MISAGAICQQKRMSATLTRSMNQSQGRKRSISQMTFHAGSAGIFWVKVDFGHDNFRFWSGRGGSQIPPLHDLCQHFFHASLQQLIKTRGGSAANCLRSPYSLTLPLSRIMISSARWIVSSRCAMMMAVRFFSNLSIARSSFCSVAGSRRDEASSRITRPGFRRKTV